MIPLKLPEMQLNMNILDLIDWTILAQNKINLIPILFCEVC